MNIYLVGGAVRDQLLGYPSEERDWVVVGATADAMKAMGYQQVGKDFPVFLHPQTGEEYALARTERKTGAGYTGFDCFASPSVTLEEDLLRRDLTINAIAQAEDGRLIDPYHGQRDIQQRCLRHVSPAFVEDPLRVLRVARFAARYAHLGFSVAAETMTLMQSIVDGGELQTLAPERVWREFEKALSERSPGVFLQIMIQCRALPAIMPELCELPENTLTALQRAADDAADTPTRFALLFYGMDKPVVQALCERLKTPNNYRRLAQLVSQLGTTICTDTSAAESLLAIIETGDAFRSPDRFQSLLACCRYLCPATPTPDRLINAWRCCTTVDAGAIARQGLQGKDIARELHRQRLLAITQQPDQTTL